MHRQRQAASPFGTCLWKLDTPGFHEVDVGGQGVLADYQELTCVIVRVLRYDFFTQWQNYPKVRHRLRCDEAQLIHRMIIYRLTFHRTLAKELHGNQEQ